MKHISFSKTTQQIYDKTKDVTRRVGWSNLEVGTKLQAIEKGQGLKKGEKVKKICVIIVTKVTIEPLEAILDYPDDCDREGFPGMTGEEFIEMFIGMDKKLNRKSKITRIEFRYATSRRKRRHDFVLRSRRQNA